MNINERELEQAIFEISKSLIPMDFATNIGHMSSLKTLSLWGNMCNVLQHFPTTVWCWAGNVR